LLRSLTQLDNSFETEWDVLIDTGYNPKCDPVTHVMILDYALCTGKLDDPGLAHFSGQTAHHFLSAHKAFVSGHYVRSSC
jgi:hypothetical protein